MLVVHYFVVAAFFFLFNIFNCVYHDNNHCIIIMFFYVCIVKCTSSKQFRIGFLHVGLQSVDNVWLRSVCGYHLENVPLAIPDRGNTFRLRVCRAVTTKNDHRSTIQRFATGSPSNEFSLSIHAPLPRPSGLMGWCIFCTLF